MAGEVTEIQDPTKVVTSKLPSVQHISGFPARALLTCLLPIQSSLGSGRSTRGVFERPRLSLLKRKLADSLDGIGRKVVCVSPAASLPRDSDDGFSPLVQATICGAGRARFGISCTDARDSVVETQLDTSGVNPAILAFIDLTVPASHSTSALLEIAVRYFTRDGSEYPPHFGRAGGSVTREGRDDPNHANEPTRCPIQNPKTISTI